MNSIQQVQETLSTTLSKKVGIYRTTQDMTERESSVLVNLKGKDSTVEQSSLAFICQTLEQYLSSKAFFIASQDIEIQLFEKTPVDKGDDKWLLSFSFSAYAQDQQEVLNKWSLGKMVVISSHILFELLEKTSSEKVEDLFPDKEVIVLDFATDALTI